jgi:hypothetical protein
MFVVRSDVKVEPDYTNGVSAGVDAAVVLHTLQHSDARLSGPEKEAP